MTNGLVQICKDGNVHKAYMGKNRPDQSGKHPAAASYIYRLYGGTVIEIEARWKAKAKVLTVIVFTLKHAACGIVSMLHLYHF